MHYSHYLILITSNRFSIVIDYLINFYIDINIKQWKELIQQIN